MPILDARLPHRTRDDWPDTSVHGPIVLAWDDRYGYFFEKSPTEVRSEYRNYTHWLPERRKHGRNEQ